MHYKEWLPPSQSRCKRKTLGNETECQRTDCTSRMKGNTRGPEAYGRLCQNPLAKWNTQKPNAHLTQNPLPKSDTNQTPQRFAPLHSKVKTMTIYEILNTLNILMVGQAGRPLLRFCRPRLRMNIIQPCPSPMATSPYQRIALYTYKEIVFTLLVVFSGS